tara:strand:- start:2663 stop:3088 length:426 start_codon:yes stop_codon:yes gene_type:complete
MFILELISSPDPDRNGEYRFFFPEIRIGNIVSLSHLYIPDSHIGSSLLKIRAEQTGLLVWEERGGFYISNGKKISGRKIHTIGDIIQIGESQIKIKSFTPSSNSIDHTARYHELTEKSPYMADLFWALKQEMLSLEKKGDS